ncbi:MAG: hypothetical protein FLDDKLPJ_01755 [Phycisphaerae bacterium]|nr:hypothetical protein [Phycisphaerae bacterium]
MSVPSPAPVHPFQLSTETVSGLPSALRQALCGLVERVLGFPALNALYAAARASRREAPFVERVLEAMNVRIDVSREALQRVPRSGPLIVVANHPFGGLDGLVLTALLLRVRPDVRILANHVLRRIPELHETCLFTDPFGGPEAVRRNIGAGRAAIRWLGEGGVLGVFPAGEVSHRTLRTARVTDPPWNPSIARLVQDTGAPVLPVFFEGRNRRRFQWAGLFHPRARTVLLPLEFLSRRGQTVRAQVGSVIPPGRLARFAGDRASQTHERDRTHTSSDRQARSALAEYLRLRTYLLNGRESRRDAKVRGCEFASPRREGTPAPIIEPVDTALLASEIESLPATQSLSQSGSFRVLYASAKQIPNVLREIGRLREWSFRAVGEGTGREADIDRFDEHYLHLFVWDAGENNLVGAYRIGRTDEILTRLGPQGLYTSTLFDFTPRLLEQINPALELGRSFVAPRYQRDYAPLMLLWKGIGRFVVSHPKHRRLFGAVSISDEYQSMTRRLLMSFLRTHRLDPNLAREVRAKNPPKFPPFRDPDLRRLATSVADLSDVEELVAEIESNRRGIPVLLRQYLKLNARLLGFNMDPDFGDVLDGLVLVDLAAVERTVLNRYLGKEGAEEFLAHHADPISDTAPVLTRSRGR